MAAVHQLASSIEVSVEDWGKYALKYISRKAQGWSVGANNEQRYVSARYH